MSNKEKKRRGRDILKIIIILFLIILPFLVMPLINWITAYPKRIAIATGMKQGVYHSIGLSLKESIETDNKFKVDVIETSGSLENINLLRDGRVDFALYQPGTIQSLNQKEPKKDQNIRFVANLYSQVVHVLVSRKSGIESFFDLRDKRVCVGLKNSGDFAMARLLLEHYGFESLFDTMLHLSYSEASALLQKGQLDAIIVTLGAQSSFVQELANSFENRILPLPYVKSLIQKNLYIYSHVVPKGFYSTYPNALPEKDIETAATGAYFLCNQSTHTGIVEIMTKAILDPQFMIENHLFELHQQGVEFAQAGFEFPIHPGAQHVYEPELKPLVNPEFVESTENIRSFIVSILIFLFFAGQWLKRKMEQRKEHRLDQYIRSLVDIERRQMELGRKQEGDDLDKLYKLLDEVTKLKQNALREFSAHQLKEDQGIDCFIEMCFALSQKINSKISLQRLDQNFTRLLDRIDSSNP